MIEVHQPIYKSVSHHTDLSKLYAPKLINLFEKIVIPNFDFKLAPNVTYTQKDIILTTTYYASKNQSAESGVLDLKLKNVNSDNKLYYLLESCFDDNISSPDRILSQIKKQNINDFTIAFDNIIKELVSCAKRLGFLKKKVTLAIDFNEDPYYGNTNNPYVLGTKRKAGTSYCFKYASICVVERKKRFTLGVLPVSPFTDKEDIVKIFMKKARKYVRISKVLLDREFYAVKVIDLLKCHENNFIMPAVKTKTIKREILRYHNGGRKQVSDYIVTDTNNKKTKVKLIILKSKVKKPKTIYDKYFVLITNIRMQSKYLITQIPKEYKKRWGIETSYRVKGYFRAKTTCTEYTVRYYYFVLSAILYNIWILFNLLACKYHGIKNDTMRPITVYVMISFLEEEIIEYFDSKS